MLRQTFHLEVPLHADAPSLWSKGTKAFRGSGIASGDLSTDVAIVGAGIAGLSTALHLHERGIEALVLEAGEPGCAATGASGGILAPEFARNGIAKAIAIHGQERGERLARMVGDSASYTFALIARYGIECDVQQRGFVSPGVSAGEVEALQADGRTWRSLGFPVQSLDERQTSDAIGTEAYAGALLFETGGALNPLAYVNGLANVLQLKGVPVFTGTTVRGLKKGDGRWLLQLENGVVSANRVILAANGANALLHPAMRNLTLPLPVYEYALSPLSSGDRCTHFGSALPYTDRQAYVFTARLDAHGRLISALPEVIPRWTSSTFLREARRRIGRVYSLPVESIEYAWSGTAYLNSSLLPAVYLPEGELNLVAIQACNGRGLAVNTILGREVARLLASGERDATAVVPVKPRAIPLHALAATVPRVLLSLALLKDRWRSPISRTNPSDSR